MASGLGARYMYLGWHGLDRQPSNQFNIASLAAHRKANGGFVVSRTTNHPGNCRIAFWKEYVLWWTFFATFHLWFIFHSDIHPLSSIWWNATFLLLPLAIHFNLGKLCWTKFSFLSFLLASIIHSQPLSDKTFIVKCVQKCCTLFPTLCQE